MRTSDTTSNSALFPSVSTSVNERAYAMASYRVTKWFQPGIYYSIYFPDTRDRSGRENYQSDGALTLRYDVNSHWLLKLEGHYMVGTAALTPALNDNAPLSALDENWGVFLAKTTALFLRTRRTEDAVLLAPSSSRSRSFAPSSARQSWRTPDRLGATR